MGWYVEHMKKLIIDDSSIDTLKDICLLAKKSMPNCSMSEITEADKKPLSEYQTANMNYLINYILSI